MAREIVHRSFVHTSQWSQLFQMFWCLYSSSFFIQGSLVVLDVLALQHALGAGMLVLV